MSDSKNRVVVGLTGPFGAGCSEIAKDIRKRRDWRSYPLSEAMREVAPTYITGLDTE